MIAPYRAYLAFFKVSVLSILCKEKERAVYKHYINKATVRYSSVESKSHLSLLRYLKYSLKLIFVNNSLVSLQNSTVVFDSLSRHKQERNLYLSDFITKKRSFIARDELGGQLGIIDRFISFLLLFVLFVVFFPLSILSKDKAKYGLILLELTEHTHLLKILNPHKVSDFYYFSAYSRDSPFLCYLLKKSTNIKISIIPSNNPISVHYSLVIADEFVFTAPYQLNEYQKLKKNWIGEISTIIWPPFGYDVTLIKNKQQHTFQYQLGFLSSAFALRKHLGHNTLGSGMAERAELELIYSLVKIVKNKGYSILIFLHPLEKRTEKNLAFSLNYYRNLFGGEVEFSDFSKSSKSCYYKAEICISGSSSSQFERLFGGFKTILAPMGELDNYFLDDSLIPITANSHLELLGLIDKYARCSEYEFFSNKGLIKYHWSWYLEKHPTLKLQINN